MSRYVIEVSRDLPIETSLVESAALAARTCLEVEAVASSAEVTVLLTDDARLRQLNRDFLGYDSPTDVLSFPSGEPPSSAVDEGGFYLGDVAISIPTAQRQAAASGHTLAQEVQLLTVHAVLHLLGYDHADEKQGRAMWARQADVLNLLGLDLNPPLQL